VHNYAGLILNTLSFVHSTYCVGRWNGRYLKLELVSVVYFSRRLLPLRSFFLGFSSHSPVHDAAALWPCLFSGSSHMYAAVLDRLFFLVRDYGIWKNPRY
jgi:hypothetical protein